MVTVLYFLFAYMFSADPCARSDPCVYGMCMSASPTVIYCSCAVGWTGALCDVRDPNGKLLVNAVKYIKTFAHF